MGLDTSHNAWHGPYSSFNTFRRNLAQIEGIDLDQMFGFGGQAKWSDVHTDLRWLLDHSDCEGHITWRRCEKIAARLFAIYDTLPEVPVFKTEYWFRDQVLKFATGAHLAFKEKKNLEFH